MVLVPGYEIEKWNRREIAETISHTQGHLFHDKGSITDYRKMIISGVKVLNQLDTHVGKNNMTLTSYYIQILISDQLKIQNVKVKSLSF